MPGYAVDSPKPLLAPVMMTVLPLTGLLVLLIIFLLF